MGTLVIKCRGVALSSSRFASCPREQLRAILDCLKRAGGVTGQGRIPLDLGEPDYERNVNGTGRDRCGDGWICLLTWMSRPRPGSPPGLSRQGCYTAGKRLSYVLERVQCWPSVQGKEQATNVEGSVQNSEGQPKDFEQKHLGQ